MFCPKCGYQNAAGNAFCEHCGSTLKPADSAQPQSPPATCAVQGRFAPAYTGGPPQVTKKRGRGLLIGLIAGGAVLIAAAVVMIVLLTGGTSVVGVWYSKVLGEVLEFRSNGRFYGYTADGDFKGKYDYDTGTGKGAVIIDGDEYAFTADGDEILFEDMSAYKRAGDDFDIDEFIGDIAVAPVSAGTAETSAIEPTAEPTEEALPSPSPTAAPETVTDQAMTLTFNFGESTGTYTGEIVNGLPEGYGIFSSVNDDGLAWAYEGQWVAGHFNGQGSKTYEDGDAYIGEYKNDYLNGDGVQYWDGILRYEGGNFNGHFDGQGTFYNTYGEVIYSGEWARGFIKETAEDRNSRVGAFKDQSVTVSYDELFKACQDKSDIRAQVQGVVLQVFEQKENFQYYGSFLMYKDGIRDTAHIIRVNYILSEGEARVTKDQTVTVWGTSDFLYSYTSKENEYLTVPLIWAWDVE